MVLEEGDPDVLYPLHLLPQRELRDHLSQCLLPALEDPLHWSCFLSFYNVIFQRLKFWVVKHSHGPYMEPSTPFPPPFFPHPTKVILDQKPAIHTGVLPLSTASQRWSPSPRRKPDSVPTYERRQGSLEPSNSQPAHCRLAGAPLGV